MTNWTQESPRASLPPGSALVFKSIAEKIEFLALLDEREKRLARRKLYTYFPDEGPLRRELYAQHLEFFRMGATVPTRCFMAANRVGKALKHGTLVATPHGWTLIESLKVGDQVLAGSGAVTRVAGVFPQGEVDLFSLSFDGVHEVVTCGDHLWRYQHPRARFPYRQSHGKRQVNPFFGEWTVGNTASLTQFGKTSRTRPVIPVAKAFELPAAELPMDAYVLGVLLGDGGLSRDSIKLSSADAEIVEAVRKHFDVTHYSRYDYGVRGAVPAIRALGLLGLTSDKKFVPDAYLYADKAARLALLQGLMDTDGSIHGAGMAMEYSTCSDGLADGFEWLAASLGMKSRRVRRHTKDQHGNGKPSWRITLRSGSVCPFRLSRKVARWRPLKETCDWLLHGVTPAGRGFATCIEVEDESHTFVIEHGIVTHNTEGGGGFETALHLTGDYPPWWEGRRFDRAVDWWAAGDTKETVRDIIQLKMLGTEDAWGTGLIPADTIVGQPVKRQNGNGAIDYVRVRHKSGGISRLAFKSYDQGRKTFQGTEKDGIWLDEESEDGIRAECVMRLMTTNGLLIETFTPLRGLTPIVLKYLGKDAEIPSERVSCDTERGIVMAGWDDVPHLKRPEKARMLAECEVHLVASRSQGIPSIGSGAIYPVPEEQITVDDFEIPSHWRKAYGLDVGWNCTAAVFGAIDPETDVCYLYSLHYQGRQEPSSHVSGIRARGDWIPGAIDPASRGRSQKDGAQLLEDYVDLGLNLIPADNSVESGLFAVHHRLATGKLKVFKSLKPWLAEYRIYRRDEKGNIVKKNDHAMDGTRYLVMTGLDAATIDMSHDASAWRAARGA